MSILPVREMEINATTTTASTPAIRVYIIVSKLFVLSDIEEISDKTNLQN